MPVFIYENPNLIIGYSVEQSSSGEANWSSALLTSCRESVQVRCFVRWLVTWLSFYDGEWLARRPNPKLEDHLDYWVSVTAAWRVFRLRMEETAPLWR